MRLEATVSHSSGGFGLVLTVHRARNSQERRIEAKSCPELVEALVAAVGLALEAIEAIESEPAESEPPDDSPVAAPAEPAVDRPPVPAPKSASGPAFHPSLGTGALLVFGVLPAAAFALEAALGARVSNVGFQLFGGLVPEQRADLEGGTTGDFSLVLGGARVCYEPGAGVVRFRGCAGGELGSLSGAGREVMNPREERVLWAAVGPDLWLLLSPMSGGFRAYARAGAGIAVGRRRFEVGRVGVVHEPSAVSAQFGAGVELEVW